MKFKAKVVQAIKRKSVTCPFGIAKANVKIYFVFNLLK